MDSMDVGSMCSGRAQHVHCWRGAVQTLTGCLRTGRRCLRFGSVDTSMTMKVSCSLMQQVLKHSSSNTGGDRVQMKHG